MLTEFSDLSEDEDDNEFNSSQEQDTVEATNAGVGHENRQQTVDDQSLHSSQKQR